MAAREAAKGSRKTRLYVWWWPSSKGKTVIYATGIPFMPQYQVEAGPGASVAYQLLSRALRAGRRDRARAVLRLPAVRCGSSTLHAKTQFLHQRPLSFSM